MVDATLDDDCISPFTNAVSPSHTKEFGDQIVLTEPNRTGSTSNESGSSEASTSLAVDSGWSRLQNRIEHISSAISNNIPVKFHTRKPSDESHGNSTSSGFSSAQHSPQGSSGLAAYENFLIVDDNPNQPQESSSGYRGGGSSGRCTGVLRIQDDPGGATGDIGSPALINQRDCNTNSSPSTSRLDPLSKPPSFWDRMRVITSAVTLRQQSFQPFTPSPSGSLLPNTSPPNSVVIASLKEPHRVCQPTKTLDEIQAQRRRTIRRYVYISQGALILIIAMVWLASNFVDLKAPNRIDNSSQSTDANKLSGPVLAPLTHGAHSLTHRKPAAKAPDKKVVTSATLSEDLFPNSTTIRPKPSAIDEDISGNRIDEDEDTKKPDKWNQLGWRSQQKDIPRQQTVPDSKDSLAGDAHKIRKRWKNVLAFLNERI